MFLKYCMLNHFILVSCSLHGVVSLANDTTEPHECVNREPLLSPGLAGNSLALLVMTRAEQSAGPFLEKLANYVASPPSGQFTYFNNYIEKLIVMMALSEYDLSRGSTDPDLQLSVRSGDSILLEVRCSLNSS